jgi:uncharacterized cupredoxin-like copper-binding protein
VSEQKRTNRSLFTGFFAVALLIVLAGCGADRAFTPTITSGPAPTKAAEIVTSPTVAATAANTAAVSVILTDYRISSFTTAFKVGETYTFTISNNGAVVHGFTLEPEGANNQPLTNAGQTAAVDVINPGETKTLTWTFTDAGKFQIASHLNDDAAKGMIKTGLVVS